jgi:hypothetical protein
MHSVRILTRLMSFRTIIILEQKGSEILHNEELKFAHQIKSKFVKYCSFGDGNLKRLKDIHILRSFYTLYANSIRHELLLTNICPTPSLNIWKQHKHSSFGLRVQ